MSKIKAFFIVLLACICFNSVLYADKVDNLYKNAAKIYHKLYEKTEFRKSADNWLRTIQRFKRIQENYPGHPKAPKSLFNIGKLYRSLFTWNQKSIYLDKSNLAFRKLASEYPGSDLSDNALYLLAENYEIFANDKNIAYLEYKNLISQYPNGNLIPKAKEKLALLKPLAIDLEIVPVAEKAESIAELTNIHFGGLSKKEAKEKRTLSHVSKIDYWTTADWSRMVINVKHEVRYRYQVLKEDHLHKQKRMYIDVLNAYLTKETKRKIAANDGLITQARIGQFDKQTVRVVLDMASLKKIKVFHFSLPNQYKIVIDILGDSVVLKEKTGTKSNSLGIASKKQKSWKDRQSARNRISLSKAFGLKVKRIILDPGHGGRDPGAHAFGLKEKDVALRIALNLRRIIKQRHSNIDVMMTRSTDKYVKLEARTAFANKNKGDLFISIHLNASLRPRIRGVETYYLNLTSDSEALMLAAKENQTSLKSISDLQRILNDLLTNSKIKESSELANKIQLATIKKTVGSQHKMRDLGVKKAPFIVLLGAQMPSILIEAGFLTNHDENKFLRTPQYRKILAEGIYQGIKKYIE